MDQITGNERSEQESFQMQVQADSIAHSARQLLRMNLQLRTSILFGSSKDSNDNMHALVDARNSTLLAKNEKISGELQAVGDELAQYAAELETHHNGSVFRIIE